MLIARVRLEFAGPGVDTICIQKARCFSQWPVSHVFIEQEDAEN